MPTVKEESACYILRSCLGKKATDTVKSEDDDIQEMWKRLDEKYGDPAKVADAIINTIKNVRPIKEEGYDLKKLVFKRQITTTSSVSIIERKLPAEIGKEWAKLVSADNSTVDKTNNFSTLLNFLLSQKRAIEYIRHRRATSYQQSDSKGLSTLYEYKQKYRTRQQRTHLSIVQKVSTPQRSRSLYKRLSTISVKTH